MSVPKYEKFTIVRIADGPIKYHHLIWLDIKAEKMPKGQTSGRIGQKSADSLRTAQAQYIAKTGKVISYIDFCDLVIAAGIEKLISNKAAVNSLSTK